MASIGASATPCRLPPVQTGAIGHAAECEHDTTSFNRRAGSRGSKTLPPTA
jgi:hypothetical protein